MSKKEFIFLFLLTLPYFSEAAMAPRMYSIMGQISGIIYEGTDLNNGSVYNSKVNFEALYLVRGGPTFGGRYVIEARNELESSAGQAYGPVAGYYSDTGIFFLVTYDILAKLGRWTNGEGFEVSLGYVDHIGDQFHIGFRLASRQMKYKTDITDNTAIQKTIREVYPAAVVMYLF